MSYRPFPNGSSFADWYCANCDRCWKGKVSDATGRSRCPIENAIALASVSDGQIPQRIAKRLIRKARFLWEKDSVIFKALPPYNECLNAMAEAEATLTDAEFEVYAFWVAWIAPLGKQIVASAIDRLKAFLIAKGLAQP